MKPLTGKEKLIHNLSSEQVQISNIHTINRLDHTLCLDHYIALTQVTVISMTHYTPHDPLQFGCVCIIHGNTHSPGLHVCCRGGALGGLAAAAAPWHKSATFPCCEWLVLTSAWLPSAHSCKQS